MQARIRFSCRVRGVVPGLVFSFFINPVKKGIA
jgi:hypothetical protein